jgi:ribose 5-phosphate isomerase
VLRPQEMLVVVVGDAKIVKPQLDKLGLPVEIQNGAANPPAK